MLKNSSFSTSPDGNSQTSQFRLGFGPSRARSIDTAKDRLLQHRRHAWHPKKCHGGPNFGWRFLVENPTKMDDLGVPPFQETTILKEDIWWKKKSASWENVLGIWLEGEFFLGPIRILRVYGRKKSRKYGASLGEASRTKNGSRRPRYFWGSEQNMPERRTCIDFKGCAFNIYLVGGLNPSEKY